MASNGFEQLCINTTNEVLQQVFNDVVFQAEAAAYTQEEIQWDASVRIEKLHIVRFAGAP